MSEFDIEEIFEIADFENFQRSVPSSDATTARVRVLQTPHEFVIEFGISPVGTPEYRSVRHYTPAESSAVANQLRTGRASRLLGLLGDAHARDIADQLDAAARFAGTKAIADTVGDDVVRAYKSGHITEEEFMHEFGREVDKALEERDGTG